MAREDLPHNSTAPCSHVTAKSTFAIAAAFLIGKKKKAFTSSPFISLIRSPSPCLRKSLNATTSSQSPNRTNANLLPEQKALLAAYSHTRIEEYFDLGAGSCPFLDLRIAGAMAAALRFREGKHYRLLAWCVMPNHVHVVVRLFPGQELAKVVKAWKNFSAKAANQALGRKGRFWQREYYDRLIRNGDELDRAIRYVVENPAKAGLKNWTWVWSADGDVRATAGREAGATSS